MARVVDDPPDYQATHIHRKAWGHCFVVERTGADDARVVRLAVFRSGTWVAGLLMPEDALRSMLRELDEVGQ